MYRNLIPFFRVLGGGANPLWDGLLAYWTADNTTDDALGNYNGTLVNGATYGTGIINQGFSLDGVNDYVTMGNVLDFDGSTPFSFSCWVYINALGVDAIFGKSQQSPYNGYGLHIQTDSLYYFHLGGSSLLQVSSGPVILNSWHHIVITYNGNKTHSGFKMYINNVSKTPLNTYGSFTGSSSSSLPFEVGRQGNAWYFDGRVDEIGAWNRELTSLEVTELYNSGAGKQYPL